MSSIKNNKRRLCKFRGYAQLCYGWDVNISKLACLTTIQPIVLLMILLIVLMEYFWKKTKTIITYINQLGNQIGIFQVSKTPWYRSYNSIEKENNAQHIVCVEFVRSEHAACCVKWYDSVEIDSEPKVNRCVYDCGWARGIETNFELVYLRRTIYVCNICSKAIRRYRVAHKCALLFFDGATPTVVASKCERTPFIQIIHQSTTCTILHAK